MGKAGGLPRSHARVFDDSLRVLVHSDHVPWPVVEDDEKVRPAFPGLCVALFDGGLKVVDLLT